MAFFKRIALFAAVNIAVMVTVSLVLNLLGVGPYMNSRGLDMGSLIAFCLVWGMVGSFISLLISKKMAIWGMGVQLIDPSSGGRNGELIQMVHRLAKSAGLGKMPDVGIYPGLEINAFATGPTKNNSLVAVSQGLLNRMDRDEVEGVLAHEVAHIANGDMVTMTLVQGVINAFVMFFARIAAYGVNQLLKGDSRDSGMGHFAQMITVFVFEIVFGIIGSVIVAWFSRIREYRADAGGARLAGRNKMIRALQKLKAGMELPEDEERAPQLASFKISSRKKPWMAFFSTHPPLEDRIARLQQFVN